MLHEILLSLSGHPSPLLPTNGTSTASPVTISPPEQALLVSVAHLSDLQCKLLAHTNEISSTHTSTICQAIALSIKSTHLHRFQEKVLEVENGILRKDAGSVGAYNIVPLTAVVGEFAEWTRRMGWFWEITQFMMKGICTGAQIIDKLCDSVQTGYSDIEDVALQLVKVAETAWLKQASAWILYGRLPSFGREDFFVHQELDGEVSVCFTILFLLLLRPLIQVESTNFCTSLGYIGCILFHCCILKRFPDCFPPRLLHTVSTQLLGKLALILADTIRNT